MANELKFRAKATEKYHKGAMIYSHPEEWETHCGGSLKAFFSHVDDGALDGVQQSTGIKDKNGRMIYEGDTVRYYGDHEVEFKRGAFSFKDWEIGDVESAALGEHDSANYEIIRKP